MHKGYVIKRILYTIFIFFIVVTLNFFIPRIGVEDPAQRYYPPQGNMSDIEYDIVKQLTRSSTASTFRPSSSICGIWGICFTGTSAPPSRQAPQGRGPDR